MRVSAALTIIEIAYIIFEHFNNGFFKFSYEYIYYIQ